MLLVYFYFFEFLGEFVEDGIKSYLLVLEHSFVELGFVFVGVEEVVLIFKFLKFLLLFLY